MLALVVSLHAFGWLMVALGWVFGLVVACFFVLKVLVVVFYLLWFAGELLFEFGVICCLGIWLLV